MSHHHSFNDEGGSRGIIKPIAGKQLVPFPLRRVRVWSGLVATTESSLLFSVFGVISYLYISLSLIGEPLARWVIKKNTKKSWIEIWKNRRCMEDTDV